MSRQYWSDTYNPGCTVCSGTYSYASGSDHNFTDPTPPGSCVTGVKVDFGGVDCGAGLTFYLNGTDIGSASTGYNCYCGGCNTSSTNHTNAAGVTGYVYGGTNTLTFQGTYALAYGDVTLTYDAATGTTATTVSASNNPSVFGQSVTLTAHVTQSLGGTPSGTVTFKDGGTTLGTGTLNGAGDTSLATNALSVGSHSITAVYEGGGCNYPTSTSSVLTQVINKAGTTSAVVSSTNPSIVGGNVTFTATVLASAPGAGTRTGNVTFKDGGTTLGTAAINGSGVATFTTSSLAVGSHPITVDYAGDGNFTSSTSPSLAQVVNQDGSSVAVVSAPNPSTYGSNATFTATVTSTGTGGTPTGTVTFKDGSTTLGTGNLNGSGVATFVTAGLLGGTHTINADYGGDSKHTVASGSASHKVNPGPSTVVASSATNPSVFGQAVTFTAKVTGSGPTPTGTVSFSDNGTPLGAAVNLVGGTATLTTSALSVGTHPILATFNGDTNYGTNNGSVSQVVDKAATTTTIVSGSNPAIVGAGVTFTATVAAAAPGAGMPGGTVNFREGATALGSGTLDGSGNATFTTSALSVGTHTITADYVGDGSFLTSTSTSDVTQTIDKDGVTASIASSLNPSTFGADVTFTATLTSVGNGGLPTGNVDFYEGATLLGSGTLDASGNATFSTSALVGGNHSISAMYGGDGNHAGGSSAALSQVVNGAATTTSVASSVNPSVFGQSVMFTASVTSAIAGAITGTVTFSDGATVLGTSTLDASGNATYSTSAFDVATHVVSAVYNADSNFATSTSAGLSQVVNIGASAISIASSSNPSLIGTDVTITATVTATAPASGTPSGTVTFKEGATVLGTGTLDANGMTTFTTNALTAGAHTLTADYGGSASFDVSSSSELTQTVNTAAATIALVAAPSPATYGGTVTLTATVSGASGMPTGDVEFKDGTTSLGTGTLDASGVATFSATNLVAGTHTLSAAYGGDAVYATGTGSASLVVNKAATTTTLASSLNPSTVGTSVTFTATVASAVTGFTGDVEFFDGTTSLGTSPLSGATATISTSALTQTGHSITATYKGNANFATSTSDGLNQTVDAAPVTTPDAGAPKADAGKDAGLPDVASAPSIDSGCGCREAPAGSSAAGSLLALAGVAVVIARRRRR